MYELYYTAASNCFSPASSIQLVKYLCTYSHKQEASFFFNPKYLRTFNGVCRCE